ncbi:MAG: hypothetical protein Q4B82_05310 [Alysiella sp.]|nr:hypothetical protein [Alysiella sp.]MDO4433982.1 hypothetical protein [Alysiella sp.]
MILVQQVFPYIASLTVLYLKQLHKGFRLPETHLSTIILIIQTT